VVEISDQAALAAARPQGLVRLTEQKPEANTDCTSRGKQVNGRFVAKCDLNFLPAVYFPT
jgi:hypothetical protein